MCMYVYVLAVLWVEQKDTKTCTFSTFITAVSERTQRGQGHTECERNMMKPRGKMTDKEEERLRDYKNKK